MAYKCNLEKAQELVGEADGFLKQSNAEPEITARLVKQVLDSMKKAIVLDENNNGAWNNRGFAKYNLG